MHESDFQLEPPAAGESFRPREPLYSLLCGMSSAALKYTLDDLNNYSDTRSLDDVLPETGLSRREMIRHVMFVLNQR